MLMNSNIGYEASSATEPIINIRSHIYKPVGSDILLYPQLKIFSQCHGKIDKLIGATPFIIVGPVLIRSSLLGKSAFGLKGVVFFKRKADESGSRKSGFDGRLHCIAIA